MNRYFGSVQEIHTILSTGVNFHESLSFSQKTDPRIGRDCNYLGVYYSRDYLNFSQPL